MKNKTIKLLALNLLFFTSVAQAASNLEAYFQNKLGTWELYDGKVERLDPKGKIVESNAIVSETTELKKESKLWLQTKNYCVRGKSCVTQVNKFEFEDGKLLQDGVTADVISVSPTNLTLKLVSPKGFSVNKVETIKDGILSEEFNYLMKVSGETECGTQLSRKAQ